MPILTVLSISIVNISILYCTGLQALQALGALNRHQLSFCIIDLGGTLVVKPCNSLVPVHNGAHALTFDKNEQNSS